MTLREIAERLAEPCQCRPDGPCGCAADAIEAALREVQATERAKHANPRDPDWMCSCGTWNNPTLATCRNCGQIIPNASEAIEPPRQRRQEIVMTDEQAQVMHEFCGWLSGDIPELHAVEVPRLADSLEKFLAIEHPKAIAEAFEQETP